MKKPELKPGDKVRVFESTGLFDGTVVDVTAKHRPEILVRYSDGIKGFDKWVFREQCRRLKPKAKPERERRYWRVLNCSLWSTKGGRRHFATLAAPGKTDLIMTELKPGEVPVSREALAAAWDGSLKGHEWECGVPDAHSSFVFDAFCKELGLSTKGEA